ncbi:DUF484 family protein [Paracoccus suum]|uniref:DUF484 family protein n=1 Tax=Paracoccus suum TaxID=2259340 RepID=A0A344PGK3_9RHOB|nr:DUF484 family protein [Paracoccus suum]AXC48508.1 DUF484 family protein [Paracoccus suum]
MSGADEAGIDEAVRARLLAAPDLILGDRDLMRALIGAREAEAGANVIDIRGRAMEALEARLTRLESAHENVIAAAYDNQAGMQTIHRAVVSLLEPDDFTSFLENLNTTVAPILRVETLRLVMESDAVQAPPAGESGALAMVQTGTVARMIAAGRRAPRGNDIILRRASAETALTHGTAAGAIRSEALLPLDLGAGRWPALLLMGSNDPARFTPTQGTDLLRFFSQVFRLVLIGWLRE